MMRLFRAIKLVLSTNSAWVDGVEWSRDDEAALSRFLTGDTGRKLTSRLRNSSLAMNAQAVQEGNLATCGRAAGYMLAIADLQSLSVSSSPQEERSEESDFMGIASLAHLTP